MVLKASSEKRKRTQVFPTPESPIRSSLKSRSYVFFAIGRSGSGSPPAAPRDQSLSLRTTPRSGVLRPEDRGSVGKRRAREGAGDLGTASSRKPRRWRRPVPSRAATTAPQPLPAAPPGSGESVGTKWPPLPLRAARPGRSHGLESKLGRRGSAAGVRTVCLSLSLSRAAAAAPR